MPGSVILTGRTRASTSGLVDLIPAGRIVNVASATQDRLHAVTVDLLAY